MAYRKTIRINPYSRSSIIDAIKELKEEKTRQEQLCKMFVLHLAEKCKESLNRRFDSVGRRDVNVTYIVSDGGYSFTLHADGQQVAFVEFGAGAEAGVGLYPYTKSEPSDDFEPGSWLKEHGHTYQAWVAAGYPGIYEYEQPPARAFDTTISDFPQLVKESADEVFR